MPTSRVCLLNRGVTMPRGRGGRGIHVGASPGSQTARCSSASRCSWPATLGAARRLGAPSRSSSGRTPRPGRPWSGPPRRAASSGAGPRRSWTRTLFSAATRSCCWPCPSSRRRGAGAGGGLRRCQTTDSPRVPRRPPRSLQLVAQADAPRRGPRRRFLGRHQAGRRRGRLRRAGLRGAALRAAGRAGALPPRPARADSAAGPRRHARVIVRPALPRGPLRLPRAPRAAPVGAASLCQRS